MTRKTEMNHTVKGTKNI